MLSHADVAHILSDIAAAPEDAVTAELVRMLDVRDPRENAVDAEIERLEKEVDQLYTGWQNLRALYIQSIENHKFEIQALKGQLLRPGLVKVTDFATNEI